METLHLSYLLLKTNVGKMDDIQYVFNLEMNGQLKTLRDISI